MLLDLTGPNARAILEAAGYRDSLAAILATDRRAGARPVSVIGAPWWRALELVVEACADSIEVLAVARVIARAQHGPAACSSWSRRAAPASSCWRISCPRRHRAA